MVQVLKSELRKRIAQVAAEEFAEHGYEATRLADIARKAGTTTSNLYKYVRDKEKLFLQVVPPALAEQHMELLRARLAEFGSSDTWTSLTVGGSSAAAELLEFWVTHRHAVAILMSNAQATLHEPVRDKIIEEMLTRSVRLPKESDGALEFVLRQIFSATLDTISAILRQYCHPEEIRHAIKFFWRFQLAGLEALLATKGQV